mgnify:FL=1
MDIPSRNGGDSKYPRRVITTPTSFAVIGVKPGSLKIALRELAAREALGKLDWKEDMRAFGHALANELQIAQGEGWFDTDHHAE